MSFFNFDCDEEAVENPKDICDSFNVKGRLIKSIPPSRLVKDSSGVNLETENVGLCGKVVKDFILNPLLRI